MTLSEDARTLWQTATALARAATAVSPLKRPLPPLLFFTDPTRTPRPWETAARLPSGAGVVFRHFGATDALETGLRLRTATREAGVKLLVGLDADLAEQIEADGVHLPERSLSAAYALSGRRPDWLLTGAAHSLKAARDLDALVLSPVFPAGGASAAKTALGIEGFKALAAVAPCPVYALGGISAANAAMLIGSGACGIAGVDAVQTAFLA